MELHLQRDAVIPTLKSMRRVLIFAKNSITIAAGQVGRVKTGVKIRLLENARYSSEYTPKLFPGNMRDVATQEVRTDARGYLQLKVHNRSASPIVVERGDYAILLTRSVLTASDIEEIEEFIRTHEFSPTEESPFNEE